MMVTLPSRAYVILFYSKMTCEWRESNTLKESVFFDFSEASEAFEKKMAMPHVAERSQWTIVEVEIKRTITSSGHLVGVEL